MFDIGRGCRKRTDVKTSHRPKEMPPRIVNRNPGFSSSVTLVQAINLSLCSTGQRRFVGQCTAGPTEASEQIRRKTACLRANQLGSAVHIRKAATSSLRVRSTSWPSLYVTSSRSGRCHLHPAAPTVRGLSSFAGLGEPPLANAVVVVTVEILGRRLGFLRSRSSGRDIFGSRHAL